MCLLLLGKTLVPLRKPYGKRAVLQDRSVAVIIEKMEKRGSGPSSRHPCRLLFKSRHSEENPNPQNQQGDFEQSQFSTTILASLNDL